ncbi:hypothetical protein IU402_04025 [Aerococcaceae bacterium zg-BR9]|uniref:hypothetical protein n=1 Tax=Aerococcaceae bacterium zg-1292 TaxID=2774330 RepID=UPI0040633422|nr:hypothetical protein [Aerococcaceae bacterium zg-BR9]
MEQQALLQVVLPQEQQDQLYQLFVNLALKAVEEVSTANTKRYLTQNELMKLFRCNLEVVNRWKAQGLRYFNKGNSIMYDLEDVHQFIDEKLKR